MNPFALSTLKQCVGFLYREELTEHDSQEKPIGTCFFVGALSRDQSGWSLYLVTARHVLRDLLRGDGEIYVRLNRQGIAAGVHYLTLPKDGWIRHPNPEVDLAVLSWWPPRASGIVLTALPLDVISSSRQYAESADMNKAWPPDEGEQVFLVGLLLIHEGAERNYPIVRMGHVALKTDEVIDLESGRSRYHIIDIQSYRGNSGAPVWAYYGDDKPHCFLGVLAAAFPSESEELLRRQPQDRIEVRKYRNYGIGAVVPGEYLVEMLIEMEKEKDKKPKPWRDRGDLLGAGEQTPFTKRDMDEALRKVSRRKSKPSESDSGSSGT